MLHLCKKLVFIVSPPKKLIPFFSSVLILRKINLSRDIISMETFISENRINICSKTSKTKLLIITL